MCVCVCVCAYEICAREHALYLCVCACACAAYKLVHVFTDLCIRTFVCTQIELCECLEGNNYNITDTNVFKLSFISLRHREISSRSLFEPKPKIMQNTYACLGPMYVLDMVK